VRVDRKLPGVHELVPVAADVLIHCCMTPSTAQKTQWPRAGFPKRSQKSSTQAVGVAVVEPHLGPVQYHLSSFSKTAQSTNATTDPLMQVGAHRAGSRCPPAAPTRRPSQHLRTTLTLAFTTFTACR
jgi:hypothetical protein